MSRRKLLLLSLCLLMFNLILGSLALLQNFQNTQALDKIKSRREEKSQVLGVNNVPKFNPNFLMSNQTFSSTRVFGDSSSVQAYLDSVNSPLRNYVENGQRASYWIFAAARGQTSSKWGVVPQINPGVLIAYLEKEQSLISYSGYNTFTDPEERIRTAMGYGCPDTSICDQEYFGFANQVNWAAYQLQFNYNQSANRSDLVSPYFTSQTVTTLDEYNVFLTNEATAASYRYTPHVYWGNYNLWKIIVSSGWGVDPNSYSPEQIDAANLVAKDDILEQIANSQMGEQISKEEGLNLVKGQYYLEQQSKEIARLQQFLRQEGFYMTREINGLYGVITDKALKAYRQNKGIVVGEFKSVPRDRCLQLINKNYNLGAENEEIKDLQRCLLDINFFDWPIATGYYGEISKQGHEAARQALSGGTSTETPKEETQDLCANLKGQNWTSGETSDRVRQLQECMRQAGVFSWPSNTGYFGPITQESLEKWKGSSSSSKPETTSGGDKCSNLKQKDWQIGQESAEVSELQECLRVEGFFSWPSNTGYFGPVTQAALANARGEKISNFGCQDLKRQTWEVGETSERVEQLQECMRQAGTFNFGSNTGYFGEITKQALIDWRGYL